MLLVGEGQPLQVTFVELREALAPLHLHDKAFVDRLHDVWKQGAPTPDSIIRDPKGYDERKRQLGNVEKRLVFPTPLAQWLVEVSAARGMPYTMSQALKIVDGNAETYGLLNARSDS